MKKVQDDRLSNTLGIMAEAGLYAVGAVDDRNRADTARLGEFPRIQELLIRHAAGECAEHYQHGAQAWAGMSAHHEWPETVVICSDESPIWVITPNSADKRKAEIRATTAKEFFSKDVAA